MIGTVLANYARQVYPYKRLIIVANGKARNLHIDCDVLLSSDNNPSCAKNEALYWLKRNGGGYFSIFDDDDYYGPEYLSEVAHYKDKATIIGKNIHYFYCSDGLYLANKGLAESAVKQIHGPTLSCQSEIAPEYPHRLNEEKGFCDIVRNSGGSIFNTTIHNYIYMRRTDNTWKIPNEKLISHLKAEFVSKQWEK